jgi:hypothetical protein
MIGRQTFPENLTVGRLSAHATILSCIVWERTPMRPESVGRQAVPVPGPRYRQENQGPVRAIVRGS